MGAGSLTVTGLGELSRNRSLGVRNTLTVDHLARTHQVEMPITAQMRCLLFEGKAPRAAMVDLMTRQPKREFAR